MLKYEIISPISESEKSKVYLASCEKMDTPVVVKRAKGADVSIFEYIRTIHNPHIPEIYDLAAEEDEVIVIEEYVDGSDLITYVNEKNANKEQIVELMLQICDGVSCLHEQTPPIIHRDLKPSNLIVTQEAVVKVIDFDASREYKADARKDTRILGTAEYAPPEQYGYSQTTVQSDIYALGVVLKEITANISDHDDFDKIIEKAAMFNPDARYTSIREMADALSGCLHTASGSLVRKKAAVVLAVIVVFFAGFGIYRYFSHESSPSSVESIATGTAIVSAAAAEGDEQIKENKITVAGEGNTQSVYDFVFYYIKSDTVSSPCNIYMPSAGTQQATGIQLRREDMGGTSMIDSKYWYQDENDFIHLSDEFFATLDEDAEYVLSIRYTDVAITFKCKVVSSTKNLRNAQLLCIPGYAEYLRTNPGDIKLALANRFGRKITKIVDSETKKELDKKYYSVDYDTGFITLKEELVKDVADGTYLNYSIYYEKIKSILNRKFPLTICVRDKAYVSPELAKNDFTLHLADMEDLQLDVTWNSGRGKLEEIYSYADDEYTQEPDTIPKKMYKVTKTGVTISKKYLKKLGKGSYQYMLEFGDVGIRFRFTIN